MDEPDAEEMTLEKKEALAERRFKIIKESVLA